MKFVKLAVVAAIAGMLSGCCWTACNKCYPYPLYDYSPARICGNSCAAPAPACAPCAAPAPYQQY